MSKIITDKKKIKDLLTRGVVDVIIRENLEKRLQSGKKMRIKLGIDPTGSDLHLGHMVVIRKLRQFQELGHQIVLIVGSFTAKIGDPTGKTETRKSLNDKEIENNFKNYARQAGKILDIERTEIRYNGDWLNMNFEKIIGLAGLFTVQQMLARDMFQERLKKNLPISVHEFLYPLMVGYDSVAVKADVELGATEQLFNLLCGRPIQKAYGMTEQDVLTTPILVGLDGKEKMSKSLNNYIGVEDNFNDMYGKIMSIPDELIIPYFELCTNIEIEEIRNINQEMKNGKVNPRDLKMKLAREIVNIYYDYKTALKAEENFKNIFQKKEIPEEIQEFAIEEKEISILEILIRTNLAKSKTEARRLIEQKGIKVAGEIINNTNEMVNITKTGILIQKGKRSFIRVRNN